MVDDLGRLFGLYQGGLKGFLLLQAKCRALIEAPSCFDHGLMEVLADQTLKPIKESSD